MLKRISRQRYFTEKSALLHSRPVQPGAKAMQLAEQAKPGVPWILLAAKRMKHLRLDRVTQPSRHSGEDRVGSAFNQNRDLLVQRVSKALFKADSFQDMPQPVLCRRRTFDHSGSDIGDHRNQRRMEYSRLQLLPERLQHRGHQRSVEGLGHIQPFGPDSFGLQYGEEFPDRLAAAGDHLMRNVVSGNP
ncbi:hypothetical protein D3C73_808310 [compost metagenome]